MSSIFSSRDSGGTPSSSADQPSSAETAHGGPPSPEVSCLTVPAIRSVYDGYKEIFRSLGIPAAGPISYATLKQEVEQITVTPPINFLRVVPEVQAFIRTRARDMIEDFKLLKASQPGPRERESAAAGSSQRTSPAGRVGLSVDSPSEDDPEEEQRLVVRREPSPASSDFTATSASTSASKRRRTEAAAIDEAEAVAAAASADAKRKYHSDESGTWSLEVRVFAPEIGASVLAQREWCNSDFAVMRALFNLPEALGTLSVGEFERAALNVDPYKDDASLVRDKLQEVINLQLKVFSDMLAARAQMTRQFRIFQLATQTYRANWQTAWELQWREREDARQMLFSPAGEYVPLRTWKEKVQAALIACHQQDGLTKDGALLGPVSPQTAAYLKAGGSRRDESARPGRSDRGNSNRRRGGGRGGGAGRRPTHPPGGGSKRDGAYDRRSKKRAGARSAGAAAPPPAAAAGPAAAAPP